MVLILLGNIAHSLEVVFISHNNWATYTWTFWLPATWLQLWWWKIARCQFQKQVVLQQTKYCLQSSLRFFKFSEVLMYIQIKTFMFKVLQSCLIKRKKKKEGWSHGWENNRCALFTIILYYNKWTVSWISAYKGTTGSRPYCTHPIHDVNDVMS